MNAHKPELDNLTPAQIRVVCEQLLYTMDCEQRGKFVRELPGLYKKIYGLTPSTILQQMANQITHEITNEGVTSPNDQLDQSVFRALQKIGL